ncbi:MAG: lipoprotein signal peptidase [Burkholderiaceae bacterium]|nr:lipoprotein signal peptidase [Burkholderiaceae bacterium]
MPRKNASPRLGRWFAIAALVVALDHLAKWVVVRSLADFERVPVLPGFFDLTLVYNKGAAFSFLAGAGGWQRWFLTAIAVVATIFIVFMLWRHGTQRLFGWSLTLILGGAVGNLIDRVLNAQVTDFVLLYWNGYHFPAFNLADSAITLGAVLLVVDEIRRVRRGR